jgi:hypothetical protein
MKLESIQQTADFLEDAAYLEPNIHAGRWVINSGIDANGKHFVMVVHNEGNSDVIYLPYL